MAWIHLLRQFGPFFVNSIVATTAIVAGLLHFVIDSGSWRAHLRFPGRSWLNPWNNAVNLLLSYSKGFLEVHSSGFFELMKYQSKGYYLICLYLEWARLNEADSCCLEHSHLNWSSFFSCHVQGQQLDGRTSPLRDFQEHFLLWGGKIKWLYRLSEGYHSLSCRHSETSLMYYLQSCYWNSATPCLWLRH